MMASDTILAVRYYIIAFWIWILTHNGETCSSDILCGVGKCITAKSECQCPSGYWGKNCEKGRVRITSPSGYLSESPGKYRASSKFTWLIDSKRENNSIDIQLQSFGTECSWDHLYVFDGRSIFDPLVAVWSGVMDVNAKWKQGVTTYSGAAFLYFYSDRHVAGEGFNMSYSMSNCTNTHCSRHGFCNLFGICKCHTGWAGKNCGIKVCCSQESYNLALDNYQCNKKTYGFSCPPEVKTRAAHAVSLHEKNMWIFGGVSFSQATNELLMYNIAKEEWSIHKADSEPAARYSHTMVYYNNHLIVYGGQRAESVTNELWKYSMNLRKWSQVKPSGDKPMAVMGHASVVVVDKMYSFFGLSPVFSFSRLVQQFDLATSEWKIVETKGVVMCGRYGHSAVYDVASNLVYVHGGYVVKCSGPHRDELSDQLFTFDPATKIWSVLPPSGYPRMLHSASVVGGLMLVYGGYTHNGTHSQESNRKCHSNEVVAFNFECKQWIILKTSHLFRSLERFGHTSVSLNRTMYVFGGFNGRFQNDIIPISPGDCSLYKTRETCLGSPDITNCVWSKSALKCLSSEEARLQPASQIEKRSCKVIKKDCSKFYNCELCTSGGCEWCGTFCNFTCKNKDNQVKDIGKCDRNQSAKILCQGLATCFSCESQPNCKWNWGQGIKCLFSPESVKSNATAICSDNGGKYLCGQYKDCSKCVSSKLSCMWCESQKLCFDTNSYVMNFPYGQCHEWANEKYCPRVKCEQQRTCQECFELPGCGWCNDKSMTGIGKCVQGTDSGPHWSSKFQCPASRWHFTECPPCQCNGHSFCINGSQCHSCKHHTAGKLCEVCAPGYYGDARTNGTCKECHCNKHTKSCDRTTGKCHCDAKGVVGDHCERCDQDGDYEGNATNGGFCYYKLKLGFQYTFNMTERMKINFVARPRKTDRDLEFELDVISGGHLYMNLSVTYNDKRTEHVIVSGYRIGKYKEVFAEDDYKFSGEAGVPAFKVYLYGWKQVTAFRISFAQRPSLFDLVYFLIVFVVCFCVLLVIMIVMWKLKQLYESYQYNRRREIEMQEMASRPFGSVTIILGGENREPMKSEPSPIAMETYAHAKAAVVSTLVELPRCANGVTPYGQSGICIASTLVVTTNAKKTLYGNQQKYIYRDKQKLHNGTAVSV